MEDINSIIDIFSDSRNILKCITDNRSLPINFGIRNCSWDELLICNAFVIACRTNNCKVFTMLQEKFPDTTTYMFSEFLQECFDFDSVDVLFLLANNYTFLLQYALTELNLHSTRCIERLLQQSDIDYSQININPVIKYGSYDICRFLLQQPALTFSGIAESPLMVACYKDLEMVEMIAESDKITQKDITIALQLIIDLNHRSILEYLLLKFGVDDITIAIWYTEFLLRKTVKSEEQIIWLLDVLYDISPKPNKDWKRLLGQYYPVFKMFLQDTLHNTIYFFLDHYKNYRTRSVKNKLETNKRLWK
jgi:hypothetical protein